MSGSPPAARQASSFLRWIVGAPLARFLVVGGVNTLFGYCAYALLLFIGFHYTWAALLGTVAGVVFNYSTTGRLVFGSSLSRGSLVRFVAVYAVLYASNVAGLALLGHVGLDPYRAGLVLIAPMAVVSFALIRTFVFRQVNVAD